ncbi:hypothetical protein [Cryptosporangium aurantiacum]|uniref:Uncharacterized protein n=1 Tax=Cryptosporangium aurantiacum TaxID=134849 RepID=A0A1M7R2E0_9ACTN|nr:hypothetical protein [Cryptosporangium aurantiacum]SHN39029.1 hypothetical protein SAMN05443668_106183 [Cryptosporangium aurantiacum]
MLAPVGHHHGPLHSAEPVIQLRLGTSTVVVDAAEYAVWLLAHRASGNGTALHTEAELAATEQVPDAGRAVDRLRQRGLLVPLPTDPADYPDFAYRHRLVPLAHGLGNQPTGPWSQFRIGLPGRIGLFADLNRAWITVPAIAYEIWRWSGATPSLAAAVLAPQSVPKVEAVIPYEDGHRLAMTVQALPELISSWSAALQPATDEAVVPREPRALPPAEPIDPATAEDPHEVLRFLVRPDDPTGPTAGVVRWVADPGHRGAHGWLFAVGHDGGPLYGPAGNDLLGRQVRVGADEHLLTPGEARLWDLARGLEAGDSHRLLTSDAVAAEAVGAGVPDARRTLDSLIERGLILDVRPGTTQARAFAARYRLQPLLHGLGDYPNDRLMYLLGVPGHREVTLLGPHDSLFWQAAGQWRSLWDAVAALSGHLERIGRTSPRDTDPEQLLTTAGFHALRRLIGDGAAYLDLAP